MKYARHIVRQQLLTLVIAALATGYTACVVAQDELAQRASWEMPNAESVQASIEQWLSESGADEVTRLKISTLWQLPSDALQHDTLLDRFALSAAVVVKPVKRRATARTPAASGPLGNRALTST